jgi:thiamine kinase-like enzyme
MLPRIAKRIDHIRVIRRSHFGKDNVETMFDETYSKLQKELRLTEYESVLALGHGDICEQNIIIHNGKMQLIDWEDVCITDPASEVGGIFEGFGYLSEHIDKDVFFDEYLKLRPDKTLRERVAAFLPVLQFGHLTWAVKHALEIGERRLHEELLRRYDIHENTAFAMSVFARCLRTGAVSRRWAGVQQEDIFPKYHNAELR